jgi:hypothetical protein
MLAFSAGCERYSPHQPRVDASPAAVPRAANPSTGNQPAITPADRAPYARMASEVGERRQEEARAAMQDRQTDGAFADAYAAAGQPLVILLFNRKLSHNIEQWQSNSRTVLGNYIDFEVNKEGVVSSVNGDQVVTLGFQSRATDRQRQSGLLESQLWKIEAWVQRALVPARFVDRTLAMRQLGSKEAMGNRGQENLNEFSVEINAFNEYADILIELLISPDWEVFGKMYDLKTAEVLGIAANDEVAPLRGDIAVPGSDVVILGEDDMVRLLRKIDDVTSQLKSSFLARAN